MRLDRCQANYNSQAITYDAIGNPLNDGAWAFTWAAGRQLKKMVREDRTLDFKYDHNGMRIQKVLQHDWYPETTKYTYHGKLLTHMTVDYTDWDEVAQQDKLHFFYDTQSRPAKVSYNGVIYTYILNLQGDIVGLLDNSGNLVVEYKYDAWGKLLSTTGTLADTLGKRNPFRYRGYVYDEETELYYLRSRYYNPEWDRFVNSDDLLGANLDVSINNLFTYCGNGVTGYSDHTGNSKGWEELGFVYDGSAGDFRRLEAGLPPMAYDNWLKRGGTISVNKDISKNSIVSETITRVTYHPKEKAKDKYVKMLEEASAFDPVPLASFAYGIVSKISKMAAKAAPVVGPLLSVYDAYSIFHSLETAGRNALYKDSLSKGMGVLEIEYENRIPRYGITRATFYVGWDGTENFFDMYR